jgi:IS5 family transposase
MGMKKQQSFASVAWNRKGKVTRRERFLAEMDAVIPWSRLIDLIEPHHPNTGKGRPPHDLERMLRIYFLQQWFNLSDPQAEDAIYDSESMRRFARVELGDDKIPDESTILRFRHRLEQHGLTEAIFEAVKDLLAEHRLTLRAGTIVDATIIAAPSSTKNATGTRDPEMKQTRKGKNWHFGMKLHIGTDRRGIVHSLTATHAAESDIKQLPHLLHGEESTLYGDQAYWKEAALPGQPTRSRWQSQPERALAQDQPSPLPDASALRASLPRDQAALGLPEGALPRPREEPGSGSDDVCPRQPLRRAPPAPATGGGVRPVIDRASPTALRAPTQGAERGFDLTAIPAYGSSRAACAEIP